ncbi:hypothetical protein ACSQ67_008220 [Phaseolus vulgaris]
MHDNKMMNMVNELNFLVDMFSRSVAVTSKSNTGSSQFVVAMAEEKDAFYVVRKGDVVGIYKSFSDIQSLFASSVSSESLSIYKGYSLPQETEEYLISQGLKGAPYSISAASVNEDLFGRLHACPYQDPYSAGRTLGVSSLSRKQGAIQLDTSLVKLALSALVLHSYYLAFSADCVFVISYVFCFFSFLVQKLAGSSSFPTNSQTHHALGGSQAELSTCFSCTLHFDGASKGNPGPAGAGAILRDESKVYRLREGVGIQTNNVAEYRSLILGLKHALKKGYKHIVVQGDSLLVCNQIQGLWKIKNPNMASLCTEAKELKNRFLSFKISHVLREYNSEADAQANLAVNLKVALSWLKLWSIVAVGDLFLYRQCPKVLSELGKLHATDKVLLEILLVNVL